MTAAMRRRLAVATVLLTLAPGVAHAGQSAEQLANRYSPILALEPQTTPCGTGEPYRPTSVDLVLGREGVVLRERDRETGD